MSFINMFASILFVKKLDENEDEHMGWCVDCNGKKDVRL